MQHDRSVRSEAQINNVVVVHHRGEKGHTPYSQRNIIPATRETWTFNSPSLPGSDPGRREPALPCGPWLQHCSGFIPSAYEDSTVLKSLGSILNLPNFLSCYAMHGRWGPLPLFSPLTYDMACSSTLHFQTLPCLHMSPLWRTSSSWWLGRPSLSTDPVGDWDCRLCIWQFFWRRWT